MTNLRRRETVAELVAVWREASGEVERAAGRLHAAQERLQEAFGGSGAHFSVVEELRRCSLSDPRELVDRFRRKAWRGIFERMEVRQFLSASESKRLDEQLDGKGPPLGPITVESVMGTMAALHSQLGHFAAGSVREVFDWLRPRERRHKTNSVWKVGKRVVIEWALEQKQPHFAWRPRPNYDRTAHLRSLDRVFHLLDGQGYVSKSHGGELVDAIKQLPEGETRGETTYFRFRCCKNGNLHLEFKRPDLVARLNEVGAGGRTVLPVGGESAA